MSHSAVTKPNKAGPVGRILRFLAGAWLLFVVIRYFDASGFVSGAAPFGVALGLVIFNTGVSYTITTHISSLNPCLGALVAWAPPVVLYGVGGTFIKLGVLLFASASLLLAGMRGDPGCEVMSIPALILRRHLHLPCFIFSPVDWLERRLTTRIRKGAS